MAFMRPEITEKQEWAAVETNSGTWWVPFDVLSTREAESARRGDFEPLLQYTEGTRVYNDQSSIKKGYGVRLSAPGYMDATDWEVYGNLKEAQRRERELIEEDEGDHATKRKPKKSSHTTKKTSARSSISRHHATKKKSPAQLEREIAEALSKSGKGHRPSKLGGDYFTVVLTRAKPASTNEWNQLPAGWDSQVRGTFPSKYAAYKWAREKLLPGAPFTIRYVPLGQ